MLEEFKNIYDIHGWLRFLTWAGLLCMALLIFWSLRLAMYGIVPLHPFLLFAALSVAWFMLCGFVLWFSLELLRHHVKQWKILDRRRFKQYKEWKAAREAFLNQEDGLHTALRPFPLAMDYVANSHSGHKHVPTDPLRSLRLPQKSQTPQKPQQARGNVEPPSHLLHGADSIADIPTRVPVARKSRVASSEAATKPRAVQSQCTRIGVGWNPGITRKHAPNEDGVAAIQGTCTHKERIVPFDLLIVADGMGGHANGQEASGTTIQMMTQAVLQSMVMSNELSEAALTEVLADGVQRANLTIWERNREQGSDMGTTLTAALVIGAKACVMNVGDSRTYLYRPGEGLVQITRDHSLVARLVASGVITPDEVYTHPGRNLIERSMGSTNRVEVDSFIVDLRTGDWLLLCSDGLWEMVRDREIERIMKNESDPAQISDMLVQAALKGGGADNVSVIVARVA